VNVTVYTYFGFPRFSCQGWHQLHQVALGLAFLHVWVICPSHDRNPVVPCRLGVITVPDVPSLDALTVSVA